jgi:hypothetical protein
LTLFLLGKFILQVQFTGVAVVGASAAADRAPTADPWNGRFMNNRATDLRRGPVAREKDGLKRIAAARGLEV